MFENFKIDLIYYNTQTDFEMEFNLCGCCRMRTFNDKCTDKKSLLLSLSRAVSRSNIIIITAPLFAEDNITKTVATAIGSSLITIDNDEHNINSTNEVQIIKNSLPLVTPDGVYGGCLIQSGPQTLILLTDNKPVRKTIMQTLIHPYVKEIFVSNMQKDEEITPPPVESTLADDEALLKPIAALGEDSIFEMPKTDDADADEGEDDTISASEDEEEAVVNEENEPLFIDESNDDSPIFNENLDDLFSKINTGEVADVSEEDPFYEDDLYDEPDVEKSSGFSIWFLIITLLLLITIAVLCYCIFYVPTKAGIEPSAYLKEIFDTLFV